MLRTWTHLALLRRLAGESCFGQSNSSCEFLPETGLSVPPHLLQALASPSHEETLPPSGDGPSEEPPALVRLHTGEPCGRNRRAVPQRMLLPLPREYFQEIAGPEKLVILSWTTGAPADPGEKGSRTAIAVNLALSIRKYAPHLERRFAYISMDTVAHKVMQEHGFNSVLCEAGPCRSKDLKDDIWKMRWYLMLTLTEFGLRVLVVDADIVFLGDPTKELAGDSDMEVMTDHFFPEKHLWEPWVRVEDHINTGFVLIKPTRPIRLLLADFLDENWQSEQGGVRRDGMDQRVFNHFIVRRMAADTPLVVGRYNGKVFGRPQNIVPTWPWRQASIRILDPARIAHGMNFFWRRAHLLDPKIGPLPVVAHVNGADPKEYFLRDRQVWFLDDWHERINASVRFLLYHHPGGQSLQRDFTTLSAAVEVAKLLGRRLVLPSTMNCRNAPSYYVWNLNVTVQRDAESGNCTFDYFSWAKNLLDAHAGFVIESSVRHAPEFLHLEEESGMSLPPISAWPRLSHRGAARWLTQDMPETFAAVLRVEDDILQVRDALRQSLESSEWDSMTCIFQQFPHQVNVCRDDRYVGRFGKGAQCDPLPGQAACGLHGFNCCMSFWGYSEKLEIFTGARWDLPCNCGLGDGCVKTKEHKIDREDQQYMRHCCAHQQEPNAQEHCMLVPEQQPMTIYGDSHFYSSYLLNDFLDGHIDPARALQRCSDHRAGTLLDSDPGRALLHCGTMIAGLALWRGRYDRAFKWLEHIHWARRRQGTPSPLSWDTGRASSSIAEADVGSEWKLRHDLEQLRYLSRQPRRQQVSPYAPLLSPQAAGQLAEASAELLQIFQSHGPESARTALDSGLAQLKPYLDRALHVPHLEKLESHVLSNLNWQELDKTFCKDGLAYLDAALIPEALQALAQHFLEATVWYSPQAGGSYLKASLFDGLHAELLLQLAAELPARLPAVLGKHSLGSLYAHKYDAEWPGHPGLGTHTLPCSVAVMLWTTPDVANLDKQGGGLEVFEATAEEGMTAAERHSWMPNLEEDQPKQKLIQDKEFASTRVPYKSNRLVMWRCDRFFRTDWLPKHWRGGLRHRRTELWLLYGHA